MSTVVVAVIFVKQFTESKSFEPYVIELEEKTGALTVVENLSQSKLTADEAIKKSLIYSFLEVAEGYNYVTFNEDRRKLMLFTTASVYRQLYNKYSIRNKDSIVNILQNRGTLSVKIKSIIFNTPTVATVRFVVYNSIRNTKLYPPERHFITEMQFTFSNMNLNTEDRYKNPLGFQVTKYSSGEDINM
jgi:type IV secretion system protein VirB8